VAEADLYPHIKRWLDGEFPLVREGRWWLSDRRALVTANLNWIDAGTWMRPDLAMVHVHRRRFDASAVLDLYTFEVKPTGRAALEGLHQALAHGRFADFSLYVVPAQDELRSEVSAQADRFGIGVVTYKHPLRFIDFEILVPPRRGDPDPDLRDLFLDRALDADGSAAEVMQWVGAPTRRRS